MDKHQDLTSLLSDCFSATEDSEFAKIRLIYSVNSLDILDYVGSQDCIAMFKNAFTIENLRLRYLLIPALGNLLLRSWILLNERDLETVATGLDTRQDLLRRKEDFLETATSFFKQLAHYTLGLPPNADVKAESMDRSIDGLSAYSLPLIELLTAFNDSEILVDEWLDSLCGLTNHVATSIRTKSVSAGFNRSVYLAPLVQTVLDVLLSDPQLLVQSALTIAIECPTIVLLVNNIFLCILKRMPPESPQYITIQPIERKEDFLSRLPEKSTNGTTSSLFGDQADNSDNARKLTEPISALQFVSDWIFFGMLPNLAEYDFMLPNLFAMISHNCLFGIRRVVSATVLMKLASISDRDITACAQQLFLIPSAPLSFLSAADHPPAAWFLTRLAQCILSHLEVVDERAAITRLLSEWTLTTLDSHFDDLLGCSFPSYHAWVPLPERERMVIDVSDGYNGAEVQHASRWQATAFKLTLQELIRKSLLTGNHTSLTHTNSLLGEVAAATILRSLYCMLDNVVFILESSLQSNNGLLTALIQSSALHLNNDHLGNNDFLDENDLETDEQLFAVWEERIEQLLITHLIRISNDTHQLSTDVNDSFKRSSVYLLQGSRRKMLYPSVLLVANSQLINETLKDVLRDEHEIIYESQIKELLIDEEKRLAFVQKLQIRAATRLFSTLVMLMDEALFALRTFMPVQIKWIQRQQGAITGIQLITKLSAILLLPNQQHNNPVANYLLNHSSDHLECQQQAVFLQSLLIWQVEVVMKLPASDLVRLRTVPALIQLTLSYHFDKLDSQKHGQLVSFIFSYCKALLTRGVEEREVMENRTARASAGMLGGGNDEQLTYSDGLNGFGNGLFPAQSIATGILQLLIERLASPQIGEDKLKVFLASMLEIESDILKAEVVLLLPSILPGHPRMMKRNKQSSFLWSGSTVVKEQLYHLIRQSLALAATRNVKVGSGGMKSVAEIDELIFAVLETKSIPNYAMTALRAHLLNIIKSIIPPESKQEVGNGHPMTTTIDLLDSMYPTSSASEANGDSTSCSPKMSQSDTLLGLEALYDPVARVLASSSSTKEVSLLADTTAAVDDVVQSCFTHLFSTSLSKLSISSAHQDEELEELAVLLSLDSNEKCWQDLTGSSDLLILQGAFLYIDPCTKESTIRLRAFNHSSFRLPPFSIRLAIAQEKDAILLEQSVIEFNEFLPVNSYIEREIRVMIKRFVSLEVQVFLEWSDMRRNDKLSEIPLKGDGAAASNQNEPNNNNDSGASDGSREERVWTAMIKCDSLSLPISRLLLPYGTGSLCGMRYYSDCSQNLHHRRERSSIRHGGGIPWPVFASQFHRLGTKFQIQCNVNLTAIPTASDLVQIVSESLQCSQSNAMWLGLDCMSWYPSATNNATVIVGWALQTLWGNEVSILLDGLGSSDGMMTIRFSDKSVYQALAKSDEVQAVLLQALTGGVLAT